MRHCNAAIPVGMLQYTVFFCRTVFNAVPFLHYVFLVVPTGVETGKYEIINRQNSIDNSNVHKQFVIDLCICKIQHAINGT